MATQKLKSLYLPVHYTPTNPPELDNTLTNLTKTYFNLKYKNVFLKYQLLPIFVCTFLSMLQKAVYDETCRAI